MLLRIGAPVVPPLCQVLKHRDERVREKAAWILGVMGDAAAVLPLCEALQDENVEVRRQAAEALGQVAERDPAPALRAALPLLRRLLAPWRHLTSEDQQTYRTALQRIEAATAAMKDLPLPAEAPLPLPEDLPIPATPPAPDTDRLPIPAANPDGPDAGVAAGSNSCSTSPAAPRRWWRRLGQALRRLWQGEGDRP